LRPYAAAGGGAEFEMLVVLDPFPAPGQAIELEGGRAPERLPIGIEYEVRPTFDWCCLECGERNGNVFRRDAEETADRNDRGRHGAVLLNDEIDDPADLLVSQIVDALLLPSFDRQSFSQFRAIFQRTVPDRGVAIAVCIHVRYARHVRGAIHLRSGMHRSHQPAYSTRRCSSASCSSIGTAGSCSTVA